MTNMETLFIGYPPCSTCKKAYKVLQDLGIEATYRNIKEDNPTKEEIQSWIHRGVELYALHRAGAGDHGVAGAAVCAGPGPAAAAAGGHARRVRVAGGVDGAEHGVLLLCGDHGALFGAVRLDRHGDRGAAVAVYVGAGADTGCGVFGPAAG